MAHIVPKTLVALPYVDRKPLPDERPDQKRIEWIRVGECLGAAETILDNSGEMNRSGVQIQKNAVTLLENDNILNDSLKEVITRVNNHDDALGNIGDDNLLTKLEELEETVAPLDGRITTNTQSLFLLDEDHKALKLKVGTRDESDITLRTVMADLLFIKKDELGNWTNKDFNDRAIPGNVASGIKYRIESQGLAIANNERRIIALEEDWINSDVGQLTADVDELRNEIGPVALAPANNIYSWIKSADATHTAFQKNIDDLNDQVGEAGGGGTLNDRLTAVETSTNTNTQNIQTNTFDISTLKGNLGDGTSQGTILYRLNQSEIAVAAINVTVNGSGGADVGLVGTVQAIGSQIGTDDTIGSVKGRLKTAEDSLLLNQQDISTLKTQVGVSTIGSETGIYRRLKAVETAIGSSTGGLVKAVADNTTAIATKIGDADKDGKLYGRQNGAWVEVSGAGGGGGIDDAPADGKDYIRSDADWKELGHNDINLAVGKKLKHDSKDIVSVGSNDMIFGNLEDKFVIVATQTNKPSVRITATDHEIWHAGNFADNATAEAMVRADSSWKPLADYIPLATERAKGGLQFDVPTDAINCPAGTATDLAFTGASVVNHPFNVQVEKDANGRIKYTGQLPKVVTVVYAVTLKSKNKAAAVINLSAGGTVLPMQYSIAANQWGDDGTFTLNVNAMVEVSQNDVIDLLVTSAQVDEITPQTGTAYIYEA